MLIRLAEPADFDQWLPLWQGYQAFYNVNIADDVTAQTWARFHDPAEPMHCAVAEADGALVGGAILPGLTLGMRALAAATARLPVVDLKGAVEVPAKDTETAIRTGVVLGAVGAVEHLVRRFGREDAVVFLTGNDAPLLAPRLEITYRTHPGLGLYGAAIAARGGA